MNLFLPIGPTVVDRIRADLTTTNSVLANVDKVVISVDTVVN